MPNQKIYDIIGVGIGPFNLGLAALCTGVPELNCLFLDNNENFNWHPGLMLPDARLQVPFYADLVTLAEPTSPFSFLAYLKAMGKMFRFAIGDNLFIKRTEYNDYCRWVATQLKTLQFGTTCTGILKENNLYRVETNIGASIAKNIVLGIGSTPFRPSFAKIDHENVFHSSEYLYKKERIVNLDNITIVGSGQSAAEIFYDLAQTFKGKLNWFTRSERFFPMDYSKLTLEMSTPDYIDHFYSLPDDVRYETLERQDSLYKGINYSLIDSIYDLLVQKNSPNFRLYTNTELRRISSDLELTFAHIELRKTFTQRTDAIILATGYRSVSPDFLKPLQSAIQKTNRNYSIDKSNSIFVQNAEAPTHGFNAADLGLGPYRNAVIINTITGVERYEIESGITFQTFGVPPNCQ